MVPQGHRGLTVRTIKTEESTEERHKLMISGFVRRDLRWFHPRADALLKVHWTILE